MYVCLCNALCDKSVGQAIDGGACEPEAVYAALGCAPVCGRCKPTIGSMIKERGDGEGVGLASCGAAAAPAE